MYKKFVLCLVAIVLFSFSRTVSADVVINEIMYDLDNSDIDWVEIMNDGGESVDLTSLKLLISNSTSNHSISSASGSATLDSGDHGVIVVTSSLSNYTSKWGTAGNIFTSSFSLPNTSATIEINDGDKENPMSGVSYDASQGGAGDGKSLQLIDGFWTPSVPTPSSLNILSENEEEENNEEDFEEEISSDKKSSSKPPVKKFSEITTEIISSNVAMIGIPVEFSSETAGIYGEKINVGKYFWNFGDGDSMEVKNNQKFTHTYFYAGEYNVSLEFYKKSSATSPSAVDNILIKVIPLSVSISNVGTPNNFFIELSNNTDTSIDISKWVISSNSKSFVLPRNTIIPAKKKLILSDRITQFTFEDKNNLKLHTLVGDLAFSYNGVITIPTKKIVQTQQKTPTTIAKTDNTENFGILNLEKKIDSQDITANALSGVPGPHNNYVLFGGFILLLTIASSAIYFLRRDRGEDLGSRDSFEILDD